MSARRIMCLGAAIFTALWGACAVGRWWFREECSRKDNFMLFASLWGPPEHALFFDAVCQPPIPLWGIPGFDTPDPKVSVYWSVGPLFGTLPCNGDPCARYYRR